MTIEQHLKHAVEQASTYSKEKSDSLGEVFTPFKLIKEMVMEVPSEVRNDPNKTWFDPCAGKGNFQVVIVAWLMMALEDQFPDRFERYKHIMENQIYMGEYQRESAEFIEETFNPLGNIKLNLYVGDSLQMPDDFFDLSWEERHEIYPEHCINPFF